MNVSPHRFFMVFFLCSFGYLAKAQQSFEIASFYESMQSHDTSEIDTQLKIVDASSLKEKNAYSGALLMKKAGLVSGPGHKLSLFKSGHKKLEASIKKNSTNAELRFLRLMVQEHAPGILGYKNNEQQDADFIKKAYKDLPHEVQRAIIDYSKQSKILKPADFNLEKNE